MTLYDTATIGPRIAAFIVILTLRRSRAGSRGLSENGREVTDSVGRLVWRALVEEATRTGEIQQEDRNVRLSAVPQERPPPWPPKAGISASLASSCTCST